MYSDYSYSPSIHRRSGPVELNSIISAHNFIDRYNQQNYLNYLKYRKRVLEKLKKQKNSKKKRTMDSKSINKNKRKAIQSNSSIQSKLDQIKSKMNATDQHLMNSIKYDKSNENDNIRYQFVSNEQFDKNATIKYVD